MTSKRHPAKANARRPGAQRGECADRPRKADQNFKQSRDVYEDRGQRQVKFGHGEQTIAHDRPVVK